MARGIRAPLEVILTADLFLPKRVMALGQTGPEPESPPAQREARLSQFDGMAEIFNPNAHKNGDDAHRVASGTRGQSLPEKSVAPIRKRPNRDGGTQT